MLYVSRASSLISTILFVLNLDYWVAVLCNKFMIFCYIKILLYRIMYFIEINFLIHNLLSFFLVVFIFLLVFLFAFYLIGVSAVDFKYLCLSDLILLVWLAILFFVKSHVTSAAFWVAPFQLALEASVADLFAVVKLLKISMT